MGLGCVFPPKPFFSTNNWSMTADTVASVNSCLLHVKDASYFTNACLKDGKSQVLKTSGKPQNLIIFCLGLPKTARVRMFD